MQKCCSSASVRVLYHTRNTKFISSNFLVWGYFSRTIEVPRPLNFSVCRVICTDIKVCSQSRVQHKYELTAVPETFCFEPFLKENFNIIDNRYLKLFSITNDRYLIELLKKENLKKQMCMSPFTFDVKLSNSIHALDIIDKGTELSVKKPEHFELVLYSTSKEDGNNSDKPTEEQLIYIINRLTYSLLNFFEKPHDFSIYHKNIVFQNNIARITIKGLTAYIQTMYILKFYGFIQYAKVGVEILKITHHIESGTIKVRWRVNGLSRRQYLVNIWKQKTISTPQDETEWIDGLSTFSVGVDGLIYKHVCDKMMPNSDDAVAKQPNIKTKLLKLFDIPQQRPISLHTLISCYKNQDFPNCKRIT